MRGEEAAIGRKELKDKWQARIGSLVESGLSTRLTLPVVQKFTRHCQVQDACMVLGEGRSSLESGIKVRGRINLTRRLRGTDRVDQC